MYLNEDNMEDQNFGVHILHDISGEALKPGGEQSGLPQTICGQFVEHVSLGYNPGTTIHQQLIPCERQEAFPNDIIDEGVLSTKLIFHHALVSTLRKHIITSQSFHPPIQNTPTPLRSHVSIECSANGSVRTGPFNRSGR